MRQKTLRTALSICLVAGLTLPTAVLAQSVEDANQPTVTGAPAPKNNQTEFVVTPQDGTMADRLTVSVKPMAVGKYLLRRSLDLKNWDIISTPQEGKIGQVLEWSNMMKLASPGKPFTYQVVYLSKEGSMLPAVTLTISETGKVTTQSVTITDEKLLTLAKDALPAKVEPATKDAATQTPAVSATEVKEKPEEGKDGKDGKTDVKKDNKADAQAKTPATSVKRIPVKKTATTPAKTTTTPAKTTSKSPTKQVPKTGGLPVGAVAASMALATGAAVLLKKERYEN